LTLPFPLFLSHGLGIGLKVLPRSARWSLWTLTTSGLSAVLSVLVDSFASLSSRPVEAGKVVFSILTTSVYLGCCKSGDVLSSVEGTLKRARTDPKWVGSLSINLPFTSWYKCPSTSP
jgi:hypothetical protein